MTTPLQTVPSVTNVLAQPAIEALVAEQGRAAVLGWIRTACDATRQRLTEEGHSTSRSELLHAIVADVLQNARQAHNHLLGPVINATGVVLHTSLGRAPLSSAACAAAVSVATACNLEVDLPTGDRRYRGSQVQAAWRQLTAAEDVLIVNNNASATWLALRALCQGKEVIISRGQLIEIGGSFRLPEIFMEAGVRLREVGTTNRTRLADYAAAIGPDTAAILRVHPSNYLVVGFADSPEIAELANLARQHGVLCIDDIGSGCLVDTTCWGLPAEPTFSHSIAVGADLVMGSGDKLLGGPQCGILLGRTPIIDRLRQHPLARCLRVDKLTLGALSGTLQSYLQGTAGQDLPTLALLSTPVAELHRRAGQIAAAVTPPAGVTIEIIATQAPVGGGSLPGATLPTVALRISGPPGAESLAERLRLGQPRLFGRVQREGVLLDLRSVLPRDDEQVTQALQALSGL